MKRFTFILLIAVLLAGPAVVAMSGPSQAQGYELSTSAIGSLCVTLGGG